MQLENDLPVTLLNKFIEYLAEILLVFSENILLIDCVNHEMCKFPTT